MDLKIDIYADGANIDQMQHAFDNLNVDGFTTNPSLMKKAGITDYEQFAIDVLKRFPDLPVSFEVFADDIEKMELEARKIASLGENVFVKIPVVNSKGESTAELIQKLSKDGIKLNVTAVFTVEQVKQVVDALEEGVDSIVSVFAGRIADTGVDPTDIMKQSAEICHTKEKCKLLWASPREVLNIIQAQEVECDIITCTPELIEKTKLFGKDLEEYSKETVQGFVKDSQLLGFSIL